MYFDLADMSPAACQQWLQHAVAPRPICFASTINAAGEPNLSPFSFFNLFSVAPPIVIFSPSRRLRDNTVKHTLENVLQVPEVVINMVDYDMVEQVSLSSCEYPKGVNEFLKAGFTGEPATLVKPPMVKESKIALECRVLEVKPLGSGGGAGNLVICEVLRMHVADSILNEKGDMIDQRKLQLVARLGGNWYCKTDPSNLFEVEKPNTQLGIGIDALPTHIRNSEWLSGNDLGKLGNVHELPFIDPAFHDDGLQKIVQYYAVDPVEMEKELFRYAHSLLGENKTREAWQVLLTIS